MDQDLMHTAGELARAFAERAAAHDRDDQFVSLNYVELKREGFFSLLVPRELGGAGATLSQACEVLHELARGCPSTALALSMHTHLVAAAVFRHLRGLPGAKLLEKVAQEQLVLVSSGASDWVDSNGSARRVEGGYHVSGRKVFASGSPAGNLLISSFAVAPQDEALSVIHCPVPLSAPGVRTLDDWHTLGMRGTGSRTVILKDVFVPEESVSLKRPQGAWHPVWDVVIGIAAPIYMSPYAGLARAAADQALAVVRARQGARLGQVLSAGRLENARAQVDILWRDMVRLGADLTFTPTLENTSAQLVRKTLLANAVRETVQRAVELVGGAAYYQNLPFERMWRDVQAVHFHPLPEDRQLVFSGRVALGVDRSWDA